MIYNKQVRNYFLIYYLIESLTTENLSIFFNRDEEKEFDISSSPSFSEDDEISFNTIKRQVPAHAISKEVNTR